MAISNRRPLGSKRCVKRVRDRIHGLPAVCDTSSVDSRAVKGATKSHSPGRNRRSSLQESDISNIPAIRKRFLVDFLPCSEEDRRLASYNKSQTLECVHKTKEISNGVAGNSFKVSNQRRMGNVHRLKRRLLTRANKLKMSQMAEIPSSGPGLRLSMPPIRSVDSSKSIHSSSQSRGRVSQAKWRPNSSISRRLAHNCALSRRSTCTDAICGGNSGKARIYSQQGQIPVSTYSEPSLSRGKFGPYQGPGNPNTGKSKQHYSLCLHPKTISISASNSLAKGTRSYGESGRSGTDVQTPHETSATSLPVPLSSNPSHIVKDCSNDEHSSNGVRMVGEYSQPHVSYDIPHSLSSSVTHDRRLPNWLGRPYPRSCSQWDMVHRGVCRPYQPSRTMGSVQVPPTFRTVSNWQTRDGPVRQFDCSGLYKQARRDKIPFVVPSHENVSMVQRPQHYPVGNSHFGNIEHISRQSVQGDFAEPNGVVSFQTSGSDNLCEDSVPINRSLRFIPESSASSLLFPVQGRESVCTRRPLDSMVGNGSLCIPSNFDHTQSATEDRGGGLRCDPDSSILASAVLVSDSPPLASRAPSSVTAPPRSPENVHIQGEISEPQAPEADCLDLIKRRFQEEGFSEQTADLAARGRRSSTLRIYSSRIRPYVIWCKQRQISPTRAPVPKVGEFLKSRFDLGLQTSTVKGYRSAIQAIHTGDHNGNKIRDSESLDFLIEGMNIERPRPKRIMPAWDLPTVLTYLNNDPFEPIQHASLRDLSIKTVFLIAMASGRRCSEIHALSIGEFTVFGSTGVTLHVRPNFLSNMSKTERSDFVPTPIFLPFISPPSDERDKRQGCPVRALKLYIDRTRTIRGGINQLFITSCKPYKPAAKATIAGWIVEAISKSGAASVNSKFSAHSTRAISSSWAFTHGISLREIMNTASWRSHSTFVSVYMKDMVPSYASTVLQAANESI